MTEKKQKPEIAIVEGLLVDNVSLQLDRNKGTITVDDTIYEGYEKNEIDQIFAIVTSFNMSQKRKTKEAPNNLYSQGLILLLQVALLAFVFGVAIKTVSWAFGF